MPLPTRHLALALFACTLVASFWRLPVATAPAFSPPAATTPSAPAIPFSAEQLPKVEGAARQPALTELKDGRLAAAWLGESEGEPAIYFSVQEREGWRPPQRVASRASTAGGAFAYVGQLSQPVLFAEGSWLHLWYGSNTLGSSINHSVSTDSGKSWGKPKRLQTSPFANFGGELTAPPLALADGGLALPIRHGFIGQRGEWLRLAPTGQILGKVRLPGEAQQASGAPLDEQRALVALRDISSGAVRLAASGDGGASWQDSGAMSAAPPQANVHAPIALLHLKSGRLLMAGNAPGGRQSLQLWLSSDAGNTWQASRSVESASDGGAEFANPALLQGRDGRIHLAYDWRQQGIKHVVFGESWLDGGKP